MNQKFFIQVLLSAAFLLMSVKTYADTNVSLNPQSQCFEAADVPGGTYPFETDGPFGGTVLVNGSNLTDGIGTYEVTLTGCAQIDATPTYQRIAILQYQGCQMTEVLLLGSTGTSTLADCSDLPETTESVTIAGDLVRTGFPDDTDCSDNSGTLGVDFVPTSATVSCACANDSDCNTDGALTICGSASECVECRADAQCTGSDICVNEACQVPPELTVAVDAAPTGSYQVGDEVTLTIEVSESAGVGDSNIAVSTSGLTDAFDPSDVTVTTDLNGSSFPCTFPDISTGTCTIAALSNADVASIVVRGGILLSADGIAVEATASSANGGAMTNATRTLVVDLLAAGEMGCRDGSAATTDDDNCESGLICRNDTCLKPLGESCGGNGECADTCINGVCAEVAGAGGTCDTDDDDDCLTSSCTGTTCAFPACAGNEDCTGGTSCIGATAGNSDGECLPRSVLGGACDDGDDEDCYFLWTCSDNGVCGGTGTACSLNVDCFDSTCLDGICTEPGAEADSCDDDDDGDCASGFVCEGTAGSMTCTAGATCTVNTDCNGATESCIDGVCRNLAGPGEACDAGDSDDCSNTGCVLVGGAPICGGAGASCSDNDDCIDVCISGTCGARSDLNEACDDVFDCSPVLACDASSDQCVAPLACTTNGECSDVGESCIEERCFPLGQLGFPCDVGENDDCDAGFMCSSDGVCIEETTTEPGCTMDSDCSGDTPVCNTASSTCVQCMDDVHCTEEGFVCSASTLTCIEEGAPGGAGLSGGGCAAGSSQTPIWSALLAISALGIVFRRRRR